MAADGEDIPGTMYWGCESPFHKMCIEVDQRPTKRDWNSVIEFIGANPDEAAKLAVEREGSLKLTPLAIVCQDAPTHVVQAIIDVAPEAISICDMYCGLPIHRAALQNRLEHSVEVIRALRDADPSTLLVLDGWHRTPLMCALESGRGLPAVAVIKILLGDGQAGSIVNKKGKSPLEVLKQRTDVASELHRERIIDLLQSSAES